MKNLSLITLLFILTSGISYALEPVLLKEHENACVLNPHAWIYNKAFATIYDIDQVAKASDSSFTPNIYLQEINYGFYQPQGWCKFTIRNISDYNDWILKIQQSRVDTVQLYLKRGNGSIEKFPVTGHFQSMSERPYYSLHFVFPVSIQKNETVTFYLYTQRQFGRHATIIDLQKREFFQNYEQYFTNFISFICGMILLAAIVGLVLYFFISDKLYLYYSIYCISFFVLVLADSGFLHALISYEPYQKIINTFSTIFYYWIVGWHILLTIALLNTKTYHRKWFYRLGIVTGYLFCIIALVLLLIPIPDVLRWWLGFFSYFIIFFMDAYILLAIRISLIKKEPGVYFYLTGFIVTIIVASILVLADLQIIDGINQNTDLYYFTPLVEIIFMVFGLGVHFSYNMKEKYKVHKTLAETQERIITIQEDERKRIAQDLHDEVGNSLAAIKNLLIMNKNNKLIEKEIDNIIEDVRIISHNLMPVDFKEYQLPEIIGHTVNKFNGHPSIRFDYNVSGSVVKISPLTELVIYRIINELINNVIKHSKASTVLIQLMYQDESLLVMVEDNGVGISKKNLESNKTLGMRSIQLRAQYINAKLNYESDHKGTLVMLEVPYEKKGE